MPPITEGAHLRPFCLQEAIAPLTEQQKRGRIINLVSEAVRLPPSEFLPPYACSKAATHRITQCLARALGWDSSPGNRSSRMEARSW
jgi:NAD(P)-dependent dehydrogenase (short-subunit alcohol dehydrogenase family)